MNKLEQLKQAAREKFHDDFYFSGVKYKKDNKVWKDSLKESLVNKVLDEIVTSTYLQAVWEMGAWIEEQDFARKVGEKTGNAEAVYEMQDVIKKIQTKLQSLRQTKN